MATHASIAIELENGQVLDIYNHGDGYPQYLGAMLVRHYSDPAKVKQLIKLGNVSIVDENIGEKIDFDDRKTREQNKQCLFYGRDRNEPGNNYQTSSDFDKWLSEVSGRYSYCYIFDAETNTWAGFAGKKEILIPGNNSLTRTNDVVDTNTKLN